MSLTLERVKRFLRLDGNAEDLLVDEMIKNAEDFLIDAIENYEQKSSNERFKRKAENLMLLLINDMYSNRGLMVEGEMKMGYVASGIMSQLQYGDFS